MPGLPFSMVPSDLRFRIRDWELSATDLSDFLVGQVSELVRLNRKVYISHRKTLFLLFDLLFLLDIVVFFWCGDFFWHSKKRFSTNGTPDVAKPCLQPIFANDVFSPEVVPVPILAILGVAAATDRTALHSCISPVKVTLLSSLALLRTF